MKPILLFAVLAAGAWPETQPLQPAAEAEPGLYAVIKTSMGSITAKLFEKETPQTVSAFVRLATGNLPWADPSSGEMVSRPLYNNLTFDHVIPGYVIQTGDPTNSGSYDCGIRIKDEFVPDLEFDRPGRLAIRNFGQPDTGTCQFVVTDDAYPTLDSSPARHGYAIFGQVVDGQEIVSRISSVPRDSQGRPRVPVRLLSVTITRTGPGPAVPPIRKAVLPRKPPRID